MLFFVFADVFTLDPFVMYIVDVNKPAGGIDTPPPPPPQPDYPSPPPNAIPFTNNGTQIPIYYNQTVVLQCLVSGVVSPVLIIRKVDHQTTVVGGGLQEGAKGVADHYCSPGEVCGDPVSSFIRSPSKSTTQQRACLSLEPPVQRARSCRAWVKRLIPTVQLRVGCGTTRRMQGRHPLFFLDLP